MTHILICDNSPVISAYLQEQIEAIFPETFTIATCTSAEALRPEVAHKAPDIVLMDVLLGKENGIDLAKEMFPRTSGVAVIFVTGYIEYCTDVYEADHIFFLLKPIDAEQLRRALAVHDWDYDDSYSVDHRNRIRAGARVFLCG